MKKAIFGAGCFWGIEEFFRKIDGVINTKVGYSGGNTINPLYEDICRGDTNHAEVVFINFDENIISYKNLIKFFWKCHDSTQLNKQGPDIGSQYRSVIFCDSDEQLKIAKESKKEEQMKNKNLIVTKIQMMDKFYLAEDYHQLFIKKRS